MNKNKFNIIGIGEILWDIYEDKKYLGGAPANFAIHCAQLGNNAIIVSRVGKDNSGQQIKDTLHKRNLSNQYIQDDPQKETGTVKVILDEKGKPYFNCTTNVAFDYLQIDENLTKLTKEADAILFGTLAQRNTTSRKTILDFVSNSKNSFKIYDINLRGWKKETEEIVHNSLKLCNAIKLNDSELLILKNAWKPQLNDASFLQFLIKKYDLKLAALTLGENGCILIDQETKIKTSGIKISPIDTTGCGDAFSAGLIHYYLGGRSLIEIAEFSNLLGAFVALFPGATPEYTLKEISDFKQAVVQKSSVYYF